MVGKPFEASRQGNLIRLLLEDLFLPVPRDWQWMLILETGWIVLMSMGTATALVRLWGHFIVGPLSLWEHSVLWPQPSSSQWVGTALDRQTLVLSWPPQVNHLNVKYLR